MLDGKAFEELKQAGLFDEDGPATLSTDVERARQRSKKEQIIQAYRGGQKDFDELSRLLDVRPSYVAQVLQNAGLIRGYFDLYTTTGIEQNVYSKYFRNILAFKTVGDARDSVARIDRIYRYFERIGDRAGQHHAMVIALTGMNRARWSGKDEAAEIFRNWLMVQSGKKAKRRVVESV